MLRKLSNEADMGGRESQAIGRSRGSLTTKIHASSTHWATPLRFKLTGGQVHDSVQAKQLIEGQSAEYVVMDKVYCAQYITSVRNKELCL